MAKKTIAIIGASGRMGSAIAKSLVNGHYRLLLFARQKTKVQQLIRAIRKLNPSADVESMDCAFNASWESDIIIPAVPYEIEKELAGKIREVATQKIVISISNPLNENADGLVTSAGTSAAEELQALLPDAKIVKAFNTVSPGNFAQPLIKDTRMDSFVAGNDKEAEESVREIVWSAGFNPIISGGLDASRTLENRTVLLIRINRQDKYRVKAC